MANYFKSLISLSMDLINSCVKHNKLGLYSHQNQAQQCLPRAENLSAFLMVSQSDSLPTTNASINNSVSGSRLPDFSYPNSIMPNIKNPRHSFLPSNLTDQHNFHTSSLLKKIFNSNHRQTAQFSTAISLQRKKPGMMGSEETTPTAEKCPKDKKTIKQFDCPVMPPCLKFVRPPGAKKVYDLKKMECGRICMPCCPPARFPPICFIPKEKVECHRKPNPRPSYSECPKDCTRKKSICDCCSIKPPPCRLLPEIIDECK